MHWSWQQGEDDDQDYNDHDDHDDNDDNDDDDDHDDQWWQHTNIQTSILADHFFSQSEQAKWNFANINVIKILSILHMMISTDVDEN